MASCHTSGPTDTTASDTVTEPAPAVASRHTPPPSCHTPAVASCHTDTGGSQRTAWLLLFGAIATALGWTIWALPESSPLSQEWLLGILATFVVWWVGWPILVSGWRSLLARAYNMDTLISLGVIVAWAWSVWSATTNGKGDIHFTMASTIIVFVRFGGWLESRAQTRSADAVASLAKLSATSARLEDGTDIDIQDLEVGMRFVVRPGERVATDGQVVSGKSALDCSIVTGEPIPQEVTPGDSVIGSTLNTNGLLVVEAERVGADTAHAQILRLLQEAQQSRAPVQRLVDKASGIFVPIVVAAAVLTFLGWLLAGSSIGVGISAGVAVLVVACPCALGLATPTAIVAGVGRAAKEGIIIKSGDVWGAVRHLDAAVLDKTGTLTEGRPKVQDVVVSGAAGVATEAMTGATTTTSEIWQVASALAANSLHPLSQAISSQAISLYNTAPNSTPPKLKLTELSEIPGAGVRAKTADYTAGKTTVALGSKSLFTSIPDDLTKAAQEAAEQGYSSVYVGWDDAATGLIICADQIREGAKESVAELKSLGILVVIATGDSAKGAQKIAEVVRPDRLIATALPEDKLEEVRRLQSQGKKVAMVGDGVNDAAALAQADVGIALSSGADVAVEASDITIVGGDFRKAAKAIKIARLTSATIIANLIWACVYNAALLPIAAAGVLPAFAAAGAMSLSSLCVVTNSLRLSVRK